jgi:hypothetical protein
MDGATIVAILGGVTAVLKAMAMLVTAVRARRETARADQLDTAGV